MGKKEVYKKVIEYFERGMGVGEREVEYRKGFEVVIGVMVRGECREKGVKMMSGGVFKDFGSGEGFGGIYGLKEEEYLLVKGYIEIGGREENKEDCV